MKYCGMDLHSNNCVVIVSDEDDRLVLGKRVPNDLGQICGALEPHRDEIAGVVVESTYNWYWLVDGLMDAGYQVHLAHPAAIKKYEGLKHSGDFAGDHDHAGDRIDRLLCTGRQLQFLLSLRGQRAGK